MVIYGIDFGRGWKRKSGWVYLVTLLVAIYALCTVLVPISITIAENDANPLMVGSGTRTVSGDMTIQLQSGKIWLKPATTPKTNTIKVKYSAFQNKGNDATSTKDNDYFGDFLPKKAATDTYMWNGVHDCRKGSANDKTKDIDTSLYVKGNQLSWAAFALVIVFGILVFFVETSFEDTDTTALKVLFFVEGCLGVALAVVAGYTLWFQSRAVNCITDTYAGTDNWTLDTDERKSTMYRVQMIIAHILVGILVLVRGAVLYSAVGE